MGLALLGTARKLQLIWETNIFSSSWRELYVPVISGAMLVWVLWCETQVKSQFANEQLMSNASFQVPDQPSGFHCILSLPSFRCLPSAYVILFQLLSSAFQISKMHNIQYSKLPNAYSKFLSFYMQPSIFPISKLWTPILRLLSLPVLNFQWSQYAINWFSWHVAVCCRLECHMLTSNNLAPSLSVHFYKHCVVCTQFV